jgi:nucleoside-triphosphatase THEP1
MHILLTAPPAIGKSTVIDSVVRQFPGPTRGIVAREVLDETGKRIGFTAFNSACQSRQFMFLDECGNGDVGGFHVNVHAIDEFVVPELRAALNENSLVYVDEIGRAQARSEAFLATLRDLMQSSKNILASIVCEDEHWSLEFKSDHNACILQVTMSNRDALPAILSAAFKHADAYSQLTEKQKRTTLRWLKKLVAGEQFVAARKLFDNALTYITENRIRRTHATASGQIFEIEGKTRRHAIRAIADGTFECDCDLFQGRGEFARAEPCSHQLTVLLHVGSDR